VGGRKLPYFYLGINMASRYYALDIGLPQTDVAEGSTTQSKTVEVAVDLADNATREQVLIALKNIENYILQDVWPPA
jgi:hypothetical protein